MRQTPHPFTPSWAGASPAIRRTVFEQLVAQSRRSADPWPALEAAHILGQSIFTLHARSHWAMLRAAWLRRQRREVLGQALRLALVPLGHWAGRLPLGNPGTTRVGAFVPLAVPAEVDRWLTAACTQAAQAAARTSQRP